MIPFRPKAAEESDSSNQTNNTRQPYKASIAYNHLDGVTVDRDGFEENSEVIIPLTSPTQHVEDPHRPLATYRPPPAPPSEAVPSSGGRSLSSPTEYEGSRQSAEDAFLFNSLFDHDDYDWDVRFQILEHPSTTSHTDEQYYRDVCLQPLELPSTTSTSDSDQLCSTVVSWKFQFSWQSEVLLFGGEQLPTAQSAGSASEASGAVVGGSSAASATGYTVQESVVSFGTIDPRSLKMACIREGKIQSAILERRKYLVDLLEEHYWRTHPPQRSDKRKPSSRPSGIDTSSRPSSSKSSSTSNHSHKITPPRQGQYITGGEDGGDDDKGDGEGAPSSRQTDTKAVGCYFACPYLKWRPQDYTACGQRFIDVAHMIGHLRERHYTQRCPTCLVSYATKTEMKNHQLNSCYGAVFAHPASIAPDEITQEQFALIEKQMWPKEKRRSEEQRWHNIFKILFPRADVPRNVYRNGTIANEIADGLMSYYWSEGRHIVARHHDELSHETRDSSSHLVEPLDKQSRAVLEDFLDRVFPDILSGFMSKKVESPQSASERRPDFSSFRGVSDAKAAKGKSARFARPTEYVYSPLSALAEEATLEDPTLNVTEPTSRFIDGSSGIIPEPSTETKPSAGDSPDEPFVQFPMGPDFAGTGGPEIFLPIEQQLIIHPHDLHLPQSGAWADFSMPPAVEPANSLSLDPGYGSEDVHYPDISNEYVFSGSGPSTTDPDKSSRTGHGSSVNSQSVESFGYLPNSFPLLLNQLQAGSCREETSLVPGTVSDNGELDAPVPWSPSNLFDFNDFPSHQLFYEHSQAS